MILLCILSLLKLTTMWIPAELLFEFDLIDFFSILSEMAPYLMKLARKHHREPLRCSLSLLYLNIKQDSSVCRS